VLLGSVHWNDNIRQGGHAGSFAAAARHFGMSAAMVSKHVQTLEEHLGARLLNRTTRRVSATEVGQHFYERCMRILSELEEAERAAGDLQTTPRGLLRVTAPVSFGTRNSLRRLPITSHHIPTSQSIWASMIITLISSQDVSISQFVSVLWSIRVWRRMVMVLSSV
jgi:DNA-binding transcriptional LysR family regulator